MKEYVIIEEEEALELLSIPLAINIIERCFREKAEGTFFAHPKVQINGSNGSLRITPGDSVLRLII